jgi:hypothetical protein
MKCPECGGAGCVEGMCLTPPPTPPISGVDAVEATRDTAAEAARQRERATMYTLSPQAANKLDRLLRTWREKRDYVPSEKPWIQRARAGAGLEGDGTPWHERRFNDACKVIRVHLERLEATASELARCDGWIINVRNAKDEEEATVSADMLRKLMREVEERNYWERVFAGEEDPPPYTFLHRPTTGEKR